MALRPTRLEQMTKQEEIIERKKREIMERQQQHPPPPPPPSAAPSNGADVTTDTTTTHPGTAFMNSFNNDGSFLENFKKLTQAARYIEQNQEGSSSTRKNDEPDKPNTEINLIPTTMQELVEMVAAGDGDTVEHQLRSRKNELPQQLCTEYASYRSQVKSLRATTTTTKPLPPPVNGLTKATTTLLEAVAGRSKDDVPDLTNIGQFVTVRRGYYQDEDDDTEDSDSEYRREAKERNLKNMKNRMVCNYKDSDSGSSDQEEQPKYEGSRYNQENFPDHAGPQKEAMSDSGPSGSAAKKRKRSRWGDEGTAAAGGDDVPEQPTKILKMDRSNPDLIKLAVSSFGSVDLDEEQWSKVEYQFRIKQVYDEMLAKREEVERLAKSGRFKYDYDSDEDLEGGTWEHKLRQAEMQATRNWAETATTVNNGRHHIGDFLPPAELKKFMEQYDKRKKGEETTPATDYQDKKLTEENKGFQMLQKLGWKDGEGLGASKSGIVNPINKSAPRESNQGLGVNSACAAEEEDNEYDAYRKRMMLAYRFRPNPLNNPRRAYY